MSWTAVTDPYAEFRKGPCDPWQNPRYLRPLEPSMDIWELSKSHQSGHWREGLIDLEHFIQTEGSYTLRIIFAPLDIPQNSEICNLIFETFKVPRSFITERVHNVCHSFGTQNYTDGSSCAWFHFLCKNLDIDNSGSLPRIANRVILIQNILESYKYGDRSRTASVELDDLPQADFSWLRSGFFLKVDPADEGKGITLVCFGATPFVRKRLEMWIESRQWDAVLNESLSLFDLVMEGIFREVDNTIWKMADVFGPLEAGMLKAAQAGFPALEHEVEFVGLHNCLKHTIYLSEAIESCLYTIDGIKSVAQTNVSSTNTPSPLLNSLSHWRTLFTSTSFRLSSLHRRVENLTGLCFNLVTQQDSMMLKHESMTMRQDANAMKILATITVVFLPTMAVASVIGSQLFFTTERKEDGGEGYLKVRPTPLFKMLWILSIPMTLLVITSAVAWSWYSHVTYPKTSAQMKQRLEDEKTFLPHWVLALKNAFM